MIRFETGDIVKGNYPIFCHQVNCKGVMGSGLAKQIRQKYPKVFAEYSKRCVYGNNLGQIQPVVLPGGRICVNLFAQDGYGRDKQYTDYLAFDSCLENLSAILKRINPEQKVIAFPFLIGCGLGGGKWSVIYEMLKCFELKTDFDVVIVKKELK